MKDTKIFAGDRLRRLRERRTLKQAALADALGISASYLSQIEADQRPLTPALLSRLADLLGIRPNYFADIEDARRASDLREATGDPLFGAGPVTLSEARAAMRAAPDVTQRFLTLYRAYLALEEEVQTGRAHRAGREFEPDSRFPYDEVRDWLQSVRNYFHPLDLAAEQLSEDRRFGRLTLAEDLARYLRDHHRIAVEMAETLPQGLIWRFDRPTGRLFLTETAPVESRTFWMAHMIALLEQKTTIDWLVSRALLGSEEA
ncbi:MAG: helix-turn-helix domain-containing protein, partial [Acetobacteraceae bacterium]|nr:helix-turn-helix domain-containing protein [Acetobacteraceae bacterium]